VTVNIQQAKASLSKLLQRVSLGEEVIITKAGKPIARIVAAKAGQKKPQLGWAKGRVWIAHDFDATPQDLIDAFHNSPIEPGE